jgi:hypothetical protein
MKSEIKYKTLTLQGISDSSHLFLDATIQLNLDHLQIPTMDDFLI